MSEHTDATISEPTAEDYAALAETAEPQADTATEHQDDDNPSRDAAKYRHRAKAAEAERDAIAGRLEVMQRGEAERLAAAKLADPQDLWLSGATLSDVLDDAGQIDPAKLDGLICGVLDAHKHWARLTHPAAAPASEVTSNGRVTGGEGAADSFVDAFAPRSG